MEEDGFVHKLVISNPVLADGGKYTVDVNGVMTEAYLEVEGRDNNNSCHLFCINRNIDFIAERDPDYKFTKNLAKKCEAYTSHTVEFNCQVNSHKANLRWFKDDEELPDVLNDKYTITKDIIGNAGLTLYDSTKSDTGTYKCRIDGTKLVTKCVLTIKGE